MLTDLIAQLMKTIHDFVSKQPASTDLSDVATTAADVVGVIPEAMFPQAALVADAVNAVVGIVNDAKTTPVGVSPVAPVVAPVSGS